VDAGKWFREKKRKKTKKATTEREEPKKENKKTGVSALSHVNAQQKERI